MTEEQKQEVVEAFNLFDSDKDQALDYHELKVSTCLHKSPSSGTGLHPPPSPTLTLPPLSLLFLPRSLLIFSPSVPPLPFFPPSPLLYLS